jgi:hypothetical protein
VAAPERLGHSFARIPVSAPAASAAPVQRRAATALLPSSGGQPVPAAVRTAASRVLGADLSRVRVHVGGYVRGFGADGLAHGERVHFAPGHYRPYSEAGRHLLGHELAHVVQQREARARRPAGASPVNADPALEAEADSAAERMAEGVAAPLAGRGAGPAQPAAGAPVQLGKTRQQYKNRQSSHKQQWAADRYANAASDQADEPEPPQPQRVRRQRAEAVDRAPVEREPEPDPVFSPNPFAPLAEDGDLPGGIALPKPKKKAKPSKQPVVARDLSAQAEQPVRNVARPNASAAPSQDGSGLDEGFGPEVRRGYRNDRYRAHPSAKRETVPAPEGERRAITGLSQNISHEVLANVVSGEAPLRPMKGTHGKVSWATVTHHGQRALPSRPYSGRDDPSNALMNLSYMSGRDDVHIPEEAVRRQYDYHAGKATRHALRLQRGKNTVMPRGKQREALPGRDELEDEDGSVAEVSGQRLRKTKKRGEGRKARKNADRNQRLNEPATVDRIERQAGVRTWKALGVHGEGARGLTSMSVPGNHPLSRPSGDFVVASESARDRFVIDGQEAYQARGGGKLPKGRRPRHPVGGNSDFERFIGTLSPGAYEGVDNRAEPEPEARAARRVKKKPGAPRNQGRGKGGNRGGGKGQRGR